MKLQAICYYMCCACACASCISCVGRPRMGCIGHRCWHACGMPWSQNDCVLHLSVFDLTYEHLVMGNCAHGVWHNSMCVIVCADGVHATHMRVWLLAIASESWFQRSNMLISTIREILMPISKDQRCWFVDLSVGTIFHSINKYNAMWRHRNWWNTHNLHPEL